MERIKKKWGVFILLLLLVAWQGRAQTYDIQQMEYYKTQIGSALQEKNALQAAFLYGQVVALCRVNPLFENELPDNLFNYGLWSTYAGNHQTSIDVLIELLDIPDHPDDNQSLLTLKARANNILGITYFFMDRWDDALVYYQKARDMAIEIQNKHVISIAENNIGNIYQKKEDYQTAIAHYLRCLQLQEEIDDKETICNTNFNLGTCYIELGNFDEGLPYLDFALNMAREIGDKEIESLCLIRLAQHNAQQKRQFVEALKQMDQAEQIAKEAGYRQVLNEVYHTRSIIEEERGDFASALNYFKMYKMLADTLFNEKTVNQLQEYEVRYQTKEKQLEIEHQQAEINRQKTRQYLLSGGLLIAGLLLVMLVYIVTLRTVRNRELADANTTKDKFFSIISHDLKNPAVAQRDAIQLLLDNSGQWDAASLSNYYRALLKSANGQVDLLYTLLGWAQLQTGRMPFLPAQFDLAVIIQTSISLIRNMADGKGITFDVQMPESAIVTCDKNMLTTVIRNLLTNAVKFTAIGGIVTLDILTDNSVSLTPSYYTISITDTGTGMTQEQIQNLFRLDRQHSRLGTAGEQGSGLGLIVCRELLQKHGSALQIESEEGKGSRFWFEITA